MSAPKIMTQAKTAVSVRLSKTHLQILMPALTQLTSSYLEYRKRGASPYSYPFRIYPPPRGFDRGAFKQEIMDIILSLTETVNEKSDTRRRISMDTLQLRSVVFALRSYVEFSRFVKRNQRQRSRAAKSGSLIDDKCAAQLKAKAQRLIRLLERHMKRANRVLMKAVERGEYQALMVAWKAHLRWMRLHIAYYKRWGKPIVGLRKRQQRDLDDLMQMAKRGLRNAGYQPPVDKDLRHFMRLYARYSRSGLQGEWSIQFLLANKADFSRTYHLAQFVIQRSNLRSYPSRDQKERS